MTDSSSPPDSDVFWLYLIGGIILLILLVLTICFNSHGHPRKWLAKRMHLDPMD